MDYKKIMQRTDMKYDAKLLLLSWFAVAIIYDRPLFVKQFKVIFVQSPFTYPSSLFSFLLHFILLRSNEVIRQKCYSYQRSQIIRNIQ